MHSDPLLQILILLAASVCVVAGVRKLKLPAILGYLAVGMLLGPHALALARRQRNHPAAGGLRRGIPGFHTRAGILVAALGRHALGSARRRRCSGAGDDRHRGAPAQSLYSMSRRAVAIVIGGAVAMSSTAIIISQLTEQSENNRTHGRLAVAICLFQDLSFPLLLALVSVLAGPAGGRSAHRRGHRHRRSRLLLVLAAGRWLLRPLFLVIASVRSAELFSLAVLLAVLASAWATHAAGLSLALGAFLAGMMLAETEFRHQIEATIRSYREVLLGLFFITVGMLLDVRIAAAASCRW